MQIQKMLTRLLLGLIITFSTGSAFAGVKWSCTDAAGHRYQASQNVPSDTCRQIESAEVAAETGSDKTEADKSLKKSNAKWGVEAFCKSQKAKSCEIAQGEAENAALNGVWFRLNRRSATVVGNKDGSSGAWDIDGNWRINCEQDKMDSTKSCMIRRGDLYIEVVSNGKVLVSVGNEHFPRSLTSLKIGPKRFDTSERDGYFANGLQLIGLMHNGTPVVTRYMKWPYRSWVDTEFEVFGVDTAVQVARWLIKNGDM